MEKPNFERVSDLYEYSPFSKEDFIKGLKSRWEIIKKDHSFNIDNPCLIDLIKEYNLEAFLPDIIFITSIFISTEKKRAEKRLGDKEFYAQEFELISALRLLYSYTSLNIQIKSITKIDSFSINNPEIIELIKESLLNLYIKKHPCFKKRLDKDLYLEFKTLEMNYVLNKSMFSRYRSKRGRPQKQETGELIHRLQLYLQGHTNLKANEGNIISRKQSEFIFALFKLLNLYKDSDDIEYGADNIYHLLVKFRKNLD